MNKYHAEYDKSAITPSVGTGAVGRVGGADDDTFSREDGAEVRAAADREAGAVPASARPRLSGESAGATHGVTEAATPHMPPRDVLG